MSSTDVPMIFRIFWIAPIAVGVITILSGAQNFSRAEASVQWKPATAEIYRLGGQRGFFMSQQWGSYRWEVAGRAYEGSDVDCCGSKWDHFLSEPGERAIGDRVTVYVDPADPASAVLVPGRSARCWMPLLTCLGLIAAGLWVRQRITTDVGGGSSRRGF